MPESPALLPRACVALGGLSRSRVSSNDARTAAGDQKGFEGKVFTRTKTNVQKELAKLQKEA